MASMRLILLLIVYHTITNDITAVPLRKIKQDFEVSGFTAEGNNVDNLQQTKRMKRAEPVAAGSTCETGAKYTYVMEPICLVKKSTYYPHLNLCLLKYCYVPGMPDGNKGANYIAYQHYLYRFYTALVIERRKMCPEPSTTIKPSFSTEPTTDLKQPSSDDTPSATTALLATSSSSSNPPLIKKSAFSLQSKLLSNTTGLTDSNPPIGNSTSSIERNLPTEPKSTTIRASLSTKLTLSTRKLTLSTPSAISINTTFSTKQNSPTKTAALSNEPKLTTKPTLSAKNSLLSSTTMSSIPNSPTKNSPFSSDFPPKPTSTTKPPSSSTISLVSSST